MAGQLTSSIPDGFLGWGKMVLHDGWKCGWNLCPIYLFSSWIVRLHFGRVRRRGELPCGESVPIHQLVVLHATQFVSCFLSIGTPGPNYCSRADGRSHRVCSSHGCLCGPNTPGPSSLYVVNPAPVTSRFRLTVTTFTTLGCPDLYWRPWDARHI